MPEMFWSGQGILWSEREILNINTEAEGRDFYESLPHFRVGKPNSTTTKCVTNVKHKDIFPEVRKGFIYTP